MKDVVVVGASLAGTSAARALRAGGFDGRITVVGDEARRPYDRPPLSKEVLTGAMAPEATALADLDDVEAEWLLGAPAIGVDLADRVLTTAEGGLSFDGLVVATGVRARVLSGLEADRDRVFTLRTLDDALALRGRLTRDARVLVIGNGFVGVEVATSARSLGCVVTLIGSNEPLSGAGALVSATCSRLLMRDGIDSMSGLRMSSMDRSHGVAELSDGAVVEFDIAVVAVGGVPNTEWLEGSGLSVADGVLCDANSAAVGADGVVAAGDVARWPNPAFGGLLMRVEHWANAVEQGKAAAETLLNGPDAVPYSSIPSYWSDHCGVRLQSVGVPRLGDRVEFTDGAAEDERFAVASYDGEELVGGQTYGIPRSMALLRVKLAKAIREKVA